MANPRSCAARCGRILTCLFAVESDSLFRYEGVNDLVMHRAFIVARHHFLNTRRDDRDVRLLASEGLDGAEGVPQGDDLKLGTCLHVASEDRGLDEAGDPR